MKGGWLAVVLLFGALGVAGCGSDDPTNPNPFPGGSVDGGAAAPTIGRGSGQGTPRTSTASGPSDAGRAGIPDAGLEEASLAPTFTRVYESIFLVSCGGAACHNPGSKEGVSFFTQMNAYISVRGRVVPGRPATSELYRLVASGRMPPSGPRLSADALGLLSDWIDAGAFDD